MVAPVIGPGQTLILVWVRLNYHPTEGRPEGMQVSGNKGACAKGMTKGLSPNSSLELR